LRLTFPEGLTLQPAARKTLQIPREKILPLAALAAIVILAAVLHFANLEAIGYGNTYYTAAVKSMLQSWHNFFFVAAEPGGSVSVDKPPLGFWLQAISAYFLGVNGWSAAAGFAVVLPEIIAGILSVVLVYHLVRRSFGEVAGLLAALVLAITPVVIATDRNNTIDSTLIFTLLLAAWAFIKATETGKLRHLLLGAALVGIGFNIKMLQAYLPLPAFYGLYLLGSRERLWRKAGKLVLASALLLAVSLSWALAVDLTPASQRPYVGSSGNNSELSLILGYNGINRLVGMAWPGSTAGDTGIGRLQLPPGVMDNGQLPPASGADGAFSGPGPANGDGFGGGGGQFPGPGGQAGGNSFMNTGQPGILRLFVSPLSKEVSWLLPFGALSMLLLAFRNRLHWPFEPDQQALVLWGGWLLTGAVFFSIAGFFHQYYLSMLAPPLAALVGISAAGLWQLRARRPWLALGLLLGGAGLTLAFQAYTARAFTSDAWWLPVAAALLACGALLLVVGTLRRSARSTLAGFGLVMIAILVTPGIWSALTTLNSGSNQVIPAAYSGTSFGPQGAAGGQGGLQIDQALLSYLQQNTVGMKYLMAVPSSMVGASYVLATGRPVLYIGGFNGQDQVAGSVDLARLVAEGQLRYIYWGGGGGPGPSGQSSVSNWVASQCTVVTGLGSTSGSTGAFAPSPGSSQGTLYDCGG
jgi:4-amino-4-deoxy-L-arabinose transferase-like glycosyltransferase